MNYIISKYKKILFSVVLIIVLIICAAFILTVFITGKRESVPSISEYHNLLPGDKALQCFNNSEVLTILTLNIAHGRKDGVNQIFQSKQRIKSNLDNIISLLQRLNPDIVALQEADGPSVWSGGFSHVAYIAENAGYCYSVQGAHVKGIMLSYGTALLSKYPVLKPLSMTFKPSPPTPSKGFVTVDINKIFKSEVKIVSVHLDFSRKTIREQQVMDMADNLLISGKPLIVMGDFNCELKNGSALHTLVEKLNLSAYHAGVENMVTFPSLNKRLDYILISKDFEFISYKVIKDIVSDHLGVISKIRKKT